MGRNQKLDLERHPEKARATHRKMRAKDRPLANDFTSDADFEALLLMWFDNASRVLSPGGGFYVWVGFMNLPDYPPALKGAGATSARRSSGSRSTRCRRARTS